MQKLKYIIILLLIFNSCSSNKNHVVTEKQQIKSELLMDEEEPKSIEMRHDETVILPAYSRITQPLPSTINDNLQDGTLTYRIDTLFVVGTTSRVEARITKKIYNGEPIEMIELYTNSTSGEIKTKEIITGEIMDIDLIPLDIDAFIINKISSNNQRVDENIITEWMWGITPQKIGNFNLILKVIIKLEDGVNIDQTIFDKIINVKNKPKRNFNIFLEKPEYFKYKKKDKIKLILSNTISDNYDLKWGGNGTINININNNSDFSINTQNNIINDDKNLYIYNWDIIPNINKKQTLYFDINIIGDNEILNIYNGNIIVKTDWKKRINEFIDATIKRWYFMFSSLLIPLFFWIKKKYFTKKNKQ